MRVIGGFLRGRRLRSVGGRGLRPTSDRVREGLFSIIGGAVPGARVADLYAGTGALGIEALSRGAARAVFVEKDPEALAVLRANLAELELEDLARVVASPVEVFLPSEVPGSYDLVMADPPYAEAGGRGVLEGEAFGEILAPGGIAVIESGVREGGDPKPPPGMELRTRRHYGDTRLDIYTRGATPPGSRRDDRTPPRQGGRK